MNTAPRTTGLELFGLILSGEASPDRDAAHKFGVNMGDRVIYFRTARAATTYAGKVRP